MAADQVQFLQLLNSLLSTENDVRQQAEIIPHCFSYHEEYFDEPYDELFTHTRLSNKLCWQHLLFCHFKKHGHKFTFFQKQKKKSLCIEEGICFTFNGLNITDTYREDTVQYKHALNNTGPQYRSTLMLNRTLDWSLQLGYNKASGIRTYPARVLGAGARAGLFIALQNFEHEVDYACRGPVQGFKVLLHAPDDIPHISKQYVRIPMGKEVLIAVKPNMITTSTGIASYDPQRRQCYMYNERHLRFFKTYTQGNCELECLTNYTLKKCGCVKYSMPREEKTPVCNEQKIYCYDRAENEILMREFSQGLKDTEFNHRGETDCNCMPACTSLTYSTEISQGNFDLDKLLAASGDNEFHEKYPGSSMARLSIYFKENQFITSKRSELYGIVDFFANCGGIFGLLMGFSFLSVIEIMYYFTLYYWHIMHEN